MSGIQFIVGKIMIFSDVINFKKSDFTQNVETVDLCIVYKNFKETSRYIEVRLTMVDET